MLAEAGTIDEAYQAAVGSSNLRVGNDHTLVTPGDLVASAGMNRHRTGLALLRLRTEWGSAARPISPTPEDITRLARSYKVETERPNAGKVRVEREGRQDFMLPIKLARQERWRWYEHEVMLALMGMRSLPIVRDALMHHAASQQWECDVRLIADVLLWWLEPKCQKCGGRKEEVVQGTGRTNGVKCTGNDGCKGTGLARQGDAPGGHKGAKVAGHINACLTAARRELREGSQRLRRTMAGESQRQKPGGLA